MDYMNNIIKIDLHEVDLSDKYNNLFYAINKATCWNDLMKIRVDMGYYEQDSEGGNEKRLKKLNAMFEDKLSELLEATEQRFNKATAEVTRLKNIQYDYADEKDYSQAVQTKVMQLKAELPKYPTKINRGMNIQKLSKTIDSGIVGSRAVLELMNTPIISELISEEMKQRALAGSKSLEQQVFEDRIAKYVKEAGKEQAKHCAEHFKLNNMSKTIKKQNQFNHFDNGKNTQSPSVDGKAVSVNHL